MNIDQEASVRIDLLGGTLDLHPIDLILPGSCTLNLATNLKARVRLRQGRAGLVSIDSKDYGLSRTFNKSDLTPEKLAGKHFGRLTFAAQILHHFGVCQKVELTLQSDSPPGAGLGGSSAMGVALYAALCRMKRQKIDPPQAVRALQGIEGSILKRGPAGWQDYHPALHGGILALQARPGSILVEQLYTEELAAFLQEHLLLVDTGQRRLSGINNWEVYKGFFDGDKTIGQGLADIARLSQDARRAIQDKRYGELPALIAAEGALRERLFPGIASDKIKTLKGHLPGETGIKVCGAGGGGCFLLIHRPKERTRIERLLQEADMRPLPWQVAAPLH